MSCGHICIFFQGLGHYHLNGTNLEIQTHFVLKIRHQNITVILCLLYYCKIRFAVLVLGRTWENLPILTQMFSFLTTRLMKYNRRRRRSFS